MAPAYVPITTFNTPSSIKHLYTKDPQLISLIAIDHSFFCTSQTNEHCIWHGIDSPDTRKELCSITGMHAVPVHSLSFEGFNYVELAADVEYVGRMVVSDG